MDNYYKKTKIKKEPDKSSAEAADNNDSNSRKKELNKIVEENKKRKDYNQNAPKTNTYGFFNYNSEETPLVNQNGENIHNRGLKSKPGKYKGTVRENDKASKIFPKIVTLCILIGTAIGIIVGLATGVGAGLAVIIIMISFAVGLIINQIVNKRK